MKKKIWFPEWRSVILSTASAWDVNARPIITFQLSLISSLKHAQRLNWLKGKMNYTWINSCLPVSMTIASLNLEVGAFSKTNLCDSGRKSLQIMGKRSKFKSAHPKPKIWIAHHRMAAANNYSFRKVLNNVKSSSQTFNFFLSGN